MIIAGMIGAANADPLFGEDVRAANAWIMQTKSRKTGELIAA
jgi:hypothetical protein